MSAPRNRRRQYLAALVVLLLIMGSYPWWKTAAKRNKWFLIASYVGLDSVRRYGFRSTQISQAAAPPDAQIPQEVARIWTIYRQYLRYAGLSPEAVAGKRFLELGPGANIGVPLLFAADGAAHVAGLDKFVPLEDDPYHRALYTKLRDSLTQREQPTFDDAIQLQPHVTLNPRKAEYVYHQELPAAVSQLGPQSYDVIASNAVMEEIYDPTPVFVAQDRLLRPGGVMVHKIDLRDYGMFTRYGFHPLEFLTVPDSLYRHMVEASGQPDRRLIDYYRDVSTRLGYDTQIYITQVLGGPELAEPKRVLQPERDYTAQTRRLVQEIRPSLLPRYRNLPEADLVVQGILLVARKP